MLICIGTIIDGDYSVIYLKKSFSDLTKTAEEEIYDFIAKEQPRKLYINFEDVSSVNDNCIKLLADLKGLANVYHTTIILTKMSPSVYSAINSAELGYAIEQ